MSIYNDVYLNHECFCDEATGTKSVGNVSFRRRRYVACSSGIRAPCSSKGDGSL